ncbi:class A beta-lactamase [Terriglobus sp. TAA 43]|uniref:class A beta-lactamase n=1 Tax=Terriglobus sp. TAA 43 TaxID=278961 RepID=UPI000645EEB5|nr:class A beta-lactamase [Terriglobus sp. TAA 43]
MLTRRSFLSTSTLTVFSLAVPQARADEKRNIFQRLPQQVATLEKDNGGRIGVYALDTGNGKSAGIREDERFPMCSTFKFLLAAAVLKLVDDGKQSLDQPLPIPNKPLIGHSPLTEPHAGATMPIAALCNAILNQSDNTAANVLLEAIGGPPAITAFAHTIGDESTRLDRNEPDLNTSIDGDPRDTTTPVAMAKNLQRVLFGNALKPASRRQITEWMENSLTGLERLRKDMPEGWRAADKTGSNGEHTTNDIAVLWPMRRPPVIVTCYITQCPGPETKRGAMIAEIGRFVREAILFG